MLTSEFINFTFDSPGMCRGPHCAPIPVLSIEFSAFFSIEHVAECEGNGVKSVHIYIYIRNLIDIDIVLDYNNY